MYGDYEVTYEFVMEEVETQVVAAKVEEAAVVESGESIL